MHVHKQEILLISFGLSQMEHDIPTEPLQGCAFHPVLNRHATLHAATEKFGVKNPPLLNIALDHVLLDELHLLLHITDVLLRNIIMMMVKFDRNGPSTNHLQSLVKAVRECGISFSVWEIKEENAASGKVGGYDWTSLMGRDKWRLLQVKLFTHRLTFMVLNEIFFQPQLFPLKFVDLFDDHLLAETVGKLWKDLYNCHNEPAMVGQLSYSIKSRGINICKCLLNC